MTKKKQIKHSSWFSAIARPIVKFWLEKTFRITPLIPDEVQNLEPPYLILPNHQGFWDPFMVGLYLKDHIFYIVSDAVFRSRFFSTILTLLGAIPKTKAQSDIDAIKNIIDLKNKGEVIGIFPEGRRTWDGVTLPLVLSTAKLIRMLKIPVVTIVIKGGFLSQPRWGRRIQRGEISVEYKLLFNGPDLKGMGVDDIHRQVAESLQFSEFEYQREKLIEYKGRKSAEGLEQVLFCCPSCGSIGSLRSKNHNLGCTDCGYEVLYNSLRFFEKIEGHLYHDTIHQWHQWQIDHLHNHLSSEFREEESKLEDDNLVFHTGFKQQKLMLLSKGKLALKGGDLVVISRAGDLVKTFPVSEITGTNVQNKEIFEFYHNGALFTVRARGHWFSAYKWLKVLEHLQRNIHAQFTRN